MSSSQTASIVIPNSAPALFPLLMRVRALDFVRGSKDEIKEMFYEVC
jgi:hypothetical protein